MGCVQSVIEPSINAATIRLLTRLGYEVVVSGGETCCGSLTHHMGKEADAIWRARRNVHHWANARVDAVIITASGCGTTIKDYGFMLRLDPVYAARAAVVSAKAKDIVEFLSGIRAARGFASLARHLSFGLFHAAWPADGNQGPNAFAQCGLHGSGYSGRPSLLRLGRHLQHHAARDRHAAPGPKNKKHQDHQSAGDRHGQYRLHHPACHGHCKRPFFIRSSFSTGSMEGQSPTN